VSVSKTKRTIIASVSNGAGATTSATESNQTGAYGLGVVGKVTNGATGPTVGCDMVVYVGGASGEKFEISRQTAPTANNAITAFTVDLPPWAMFVNVDFTGNTVQAVTVEAHIEELTTI
jgi:hypothetical protein